MPRSSLGDNQSANGTDMRVLDDVPVRATPIRMTEASFKDFLDLTSGPAKPVPEMVELFRRKAPWESPDENIR